MRQAAGPKCFDPVELHARLGPPRRRGLHPGLDRHPEQKGSGTDGHAVAASRHNPRERNRAEPKRRLARQAHPLAHLVEDELAIEGDDDGGCRPGQGLAPPGSRK